MYDRDPQQQWIFFCFLPCNSGRSTTSTVFIDLSVSIYNTYTNLKPKLIKRFKEADVHFFQELRRGSEGNHQGTNYTRPDGKLLFLPIRRKSRVLSNPNLLIQCFLE